MEQRVHDGQQGAVIPVVVLGSLVVLLVVVLGSLVVVLVVVRIGYLPAEEQRVHDGQQGAGPVLTLGDDGSLLLLPGDPLHQVVCRHGRAAAPCGRPGNYNQTQLSQRLIQVTRV